MKWRSNLMAVYRHRQHLSQSCKTYRTWFKYICLIFLLFYFNSYSLVPGDVRVHSADLATKSHKSKKKLLLSKKTTAIQREGSIERKGTYIWILSRQHHQHARPSHQLKGRCTFKKKKKGNTLTCLVKMGYSRWGCHSSEQVIRLSRLMNRWKHTLEYDRRRGSSLAASLLCWSCLKPPLSLPPHQLFSLDYLNNKFFSVILGNN